MRAAVVVSQGVTRFSKDQSLGLKKSSYAGWKWVSQIHAVIGGLAKASEDVVEAVFLNRGLQLEENLLRIGAKEFYKLFVLILGFDVGFALRPAIQFSGFLIRTSRERVIFKS